MTILRSLTRCAHNDYYSFALINVYIVKNYFASARGALQLVPSCARVLSLPVFSAKSRSATGFAEDFQERRGVNVKTNDSGCKERGTEEGGLVEGGKESEGPRGGEKGGKENIHGRRGYKGGCSHPDDDNSFLFPSQPRLSFAQAFDFYFSRRPCHFFNLPSSLFPLPRGGYFQIPFTAIWKVYLNVFRDRAIHPYCSASPIGFQFFESGPRPYLFTVIWAPWHLSG